MNNETPEPAVQRATILKLTKFQTWIGCIVGFIGLCTTLAAIAHGWIGLPQKVQEIQNQQAEIQAKQIPLMLLTNRVDTLENGQKAVWAKVSADHDLLLGINQKLSDMDERQKETAQDVKALKK